MKYQIAEAIIENGQIASVNKKLPPGKITVHIIYEVEPNKDKEDQSKVLSETFGIYPHINGELESKKLRSEWDREESGFNTGL